MYIGCVFNRAFEQYILHMHILDIFVYRHLFVKFITTLEFHFNYHFAIYSSSVNEKHQCL